MGISTNAPYNFLHFSQQYTVHIMALRGKNRAGFSYVCVCVLSKIKISTSNIIPIYYCGAAMGGVAARIGYGYILSMADVNSAQIGSDGATRL